MEWGLLLLGGGLSVQSGRPNLGFLEPRPFRCENASFEGWKGLDFLGFSRQNLAFSTGYAGFSLNEISRPLLPPAQDREMAGHDFGPWKGADWSWDKLNYISAFLQEIAGLIALAMDPRLVQVIQKCAKQNVMAGLDPAIHAASAPSASHFKFR
jgi:hypothetical protein